MGEHEFAEGLADRSQGLVLRHGVVHQRLHALAPGAIEGRGHDEQRHEQGERGQHDIGRRTLQAEAGAQERQRDDEAREARHHDEQAGRDGERGEDRSDLQHAARRRGAARRDQRTEIDILRQSRARQGEEQRAGQRQPPHCSTSVLMRRSVTFPPERT